MERGGTARQAIGDNIMWCRKYAICLPDKLRPDYRHTLRMFITYCFSTATVVTLTHLDVTLYVRYVSW